MMKTRADTLAALRAAIAEYEGDTGPGAWRAQSFSGFGDDAVGLTYEVEIVGDGPEPHPAIKYGEEPWEMWGGDAILEAAGLESFDGLSESYTDKFGAGIYADSAIIEVQDLGTVTFKGVTYMLNGQAVEAFGADGEVFYHAPAFDSDGAEYRVVWETTDEWDATRFYEEQKAKGRQVDMSEVRAGFELDDDWEPGDPSDETLACDWEKPLSVTLAD